MTDTFYSIGASLAQQVNIEDTYGLIANSMQQNRIPLKPPTKRRLASGKSVRNGKVDRPLAFSVEEHAQLIAFIDAVWSSYTASSVDVYVTALDTRGFYSPFLVTLDTPYEDEDYESVNGTWSREISVQGFGWTLQSQTVTSNLSVTSGDKLIYGDTSGGNVILTLPPANGVNANVPYGFVKTAAANTLSIQRQGSDTIDGSNVINLTALNARAQIVSDGVSAWRSIT